MLHDLGSEVVFWFVPFPDLQERGLPIARRALWESGNLHVVALGAELTVLTEEQSDLLVLHAPGERVGFRPTSSSRRPMCSAESSLSDWMCNKCLFDRSLERPQVDTDVLLRHTIRVPVSPTLETTSPARRRFSTSGFSVRCDALQPRLRRILRAPPQAMQCGVLTQLSIEHVTCTLRHSGSTRERACPGEVLLES